MDIPKLNQDAKMECLGYKRNTSRTRQTVANLRRIVEFVRDHPMSTQAEIADLLCYSMSGARKYVYTLEKSGILCLTMAPQKDGGQRYPVPHYSLVDNEALVQSFLDGTKTLALGRGETGDRPVVNRKAGKGQLIPGTRVYIAMDDDFYARRTPQNAKFEVKRDPMDQWFFGDGPARSLTLEAETV